MKKDVVVESCVDEQSMIHHNVHSVLVHINMWQQPQCNKLLQIIISSCKMEVIPTCCCVLYTSTIHIHTSGQNKKTTDQSKRGFGEMA